MSRSTYQWNYWDITGSTKFKTAASKNEYINNSSCRRNRNNISMAISMFYGASYSMRRSRTLYSQTGSGNPRWRLKTGRNYISSCRQDTNDFLTDNGYNIRFRGPSIQWDYQECCATLLEVENP